MIYVTENLRVRVIDSFTPFLTYKGANCFTVKASSRQRLEHNLSADVTARSRRDFASQADSRTKKVKRSKDERNRIGEL